MNSTDKRGLIYGDLTYKVRGCVFNVYNELGSGHKEQVYQKVLAKEFKDKEISFKREKSIDVKYKNESVGFYRPDFLVEDKILLELKAVEFMTKIFEQQLLHYLKTTGYKLGLLINFGGSKVYIKRLIWTDDPR